MNMRNEQKERAKDCILINQLHIAKQWLIEHKHEDLIISFFLSENSNREKQKSINFLIDDAFLRVRIPKPPKTGIEQTQHVR